MRFQYAIRRNDPVQEQRDRELEDYLARAEIMQRISRNERFKIMEPTLQTRTSASFTDFTFGGTPYTVQFTKELGSDESVIAATFHASSFTTSATAAHTFGLNINGGDYIIARNFHNSANIHRSFSCLLNVQLIPAGTYTVTARWASDGVNNASVDSNDRLAFHLREVLL